MSAAEIVIAEAVEADVPVILGFIRGLAEYERLASSCIATENALRETLFGERRYAEVLIARVDGEAAGFALFFHNYSTFLAKPGIYLEDLFVKPESRGRGVGKALLARLARVAVERGCGRLDWAVLDWNAPAIRLYESLGASKFEDWRICRLSDGALEELARQGH